MQKLIQKKTGKCANYKDAGGSNNKNVYFECVKNCNSGATYLGKIERVFQGRRESVSYIGKRHEAILSQGKIYL